YAVVRRRVVGCRDDDARAGPVEAQERGAGGCREDSHVDDVEALAEDAGADGGGEERPALARVAREADPPDPGGVRGLPPDGAADGDDRRQIQGKPVRLAADA